MTINNPLADNSVDLEDQELVLRARSGDRQALEDLVRRHQGWIYNIAVRMLYHLQDAEDATEEILIKVLTRLSSFEGRSSFRTWLYRIVVNHVLNVKREPVDVRDSWLRRSDLDGTLERFFSPSLTDHERKVDENRWLDTGDGLRQEGRVRASDTPGSLANAGLRCHDGTLGVARHLLTYAWRRRNSVVGEGTALPNCRQKRPSPRRRHNGMV